MSAENVFALKIGDCGGDPGQKFSFETVVVCKERNAS